MNALVEKYEIKMCNKVWMIFVNLYSKDPQLDPTITPSCVGVRSLSLSSLSQRNAVTARKTSSSCSVAYPELVSRGVSKSRKFKWLVKVGACKDVNPLIKKNHGRGGGVSGQPETPPGYATAC